MCFTISNLPISLARQMVPGSRVSFPVSFVMTLSGCGVIGGFAVLFPMESLKCLCVRRLAVRCDGNDDRRPSRYHLLVICAAWCSFYGHCSRRCAKRVGGCFRAHRSSIPVYVPTSTPSAGLAGSNGDGSRWPRRSNRVVTASSLDFLRQR